MVDIHSHILPGIDDGAEDMYDTLDMLQMAVDSGVTQIVATPHCNIPGLYRNYFGKEYIEKYNNVVKAVKEERIPIQVLPGMEAFSTDDLPELITDDKIMPINQSRYILLEFAFDEDPDFADDLLRRVREVGAKPVIAHVERYDFVKDDPETVYRWRRQGYVIQVNKGSFQGRFGSRIQNVAYDLLEHNLVSVIASDAHGPSRRTPYMQDVYEDLRMDFPKKLLDVLFQWNPERICSNRSILKLDPISFAEEDRIFEGV